MRKRERYVKHKLSDSDESGSLKFEDCLMRKGCEADENDW